MRSAALPIVALALIAAGCGDKGVGPLGGGLFTLTRVDENALPARGATTITVRGSLNLSDDHKFTLVQTDSAITGGALTQFSASGSWNINENALVLTGGPELYLGVAYGLIDSVRLTFGTHANMYKK